MANRELHHQIRSNIEHELGGRTWVWLADKSGIHIDLRQTRPTRVAFVRYGGDQGQQQGSWLPPHWKAQFVELDEVCESLGWADLVVISVKDISKDFSLLRESVRQFREERPVFLHLGNRPGNFRYLLEIDVDGVLVSGHDEPDLERFFQRTKTGSPVAVLIEKVSSDLSIPPVIRHGVVRALSDLSGRRIQRTRGERPSVEKVARECGCSREYLSRRLAESGVRVGKLLRWAALVHAAFLKKNGQGNWKAISKTLGFRTANSFSGFSRRLTGLGLRDLETADPDELVKEALDL